MGKYKGQDGKFCQIYWPAIIKINEANKKVPHSTRWLYTHLHLIEHLSSGGNWRRKVFFEGEKEKQDWFYRSIEDLSKETGIGRRQVIGGIKTLRNLGLIKTWQMHWKSKGVRSRSHVTAFRILEVPYEGKYKL